MKDKVCIFFIGIFLLASLAPTFYELSARSKLQPNRAFELVHNFPTDFNFYLSRIRQGIEGNVTVKEQYTSEPHKGSFIHVLYLFFGWLGRWTRTPWNRAADVYHVARIVFGGLLLVMIAAFCKKAFSYPFSFLAFLLAITSSTWPKLVAVVNTQVVAPTINNILNWRLGGYMPWWSVMDSLQRITFIPHLLLGQSLILFLIMAMSDHDTMKKPGNWIFLGVLAFLLGIIFPPGLLFVIVTAGILTLGEFLFAKNGVISVAAASKIILSRASTVVLGTPSLLYLSLMTSFYPWKRLAEFDIIKPLPFQYGEYLLAVGPILPIGAIGLVLALLKRDGRMLPSVAWVLSWGMLLFIFRFIPQQSPLRFSEMIPHVPLGVLSAYLFYNFYNRYNNYKYYILLPAALIAVGVGVMYSSWLWQRDFVDHKIRATYPLVPTGSYVMYPLKDFLSAMRFIQDATSRETVILAETTAGNYLPVYSGNTVYVGHANTVRAEEKEALVKEFYSARMKPEDARTFLTRENLRWIFFGPQEKEDGGVPDLARVYPFLTEEYKNAYVTVYQARL